MNKEIFSDKKFLYGAIAFLLLTVIGGAGVFGFFEYQNYKDQKQLDIIHEVLNEGSIDKNSCIQMYGVNQKLIQDEMKFFRLNEYNDFKTKCDARFDISKTEQTLEFCEKVIVGSKKSFQQEYIQLDGFKDVQTQCTLEYLTVKFSTGSLFDVENDFRSFVNLDFGISFYEDRGKVNSQQFLDNRIAAKKRLIDLIEISPKIELTEDNVVLYQKKAILELNLAAETSYTFSMKSFDSGIEGEEVESEDFVLITPEHKYFGIRIQQKVSLFSDSTPPDFELVSYDSEKTGAVMKLCRIENESYAKIEVFRETDGLFSEKKEFFKTGIDKISSYDCVTKKISFEGETSGDVFQKKSFNFDSEIGKISRSGLYYLTFENTEDREIVGRVQEAIFFGIVDSHITMKVSRNGEAFFFVNDLSGKALSKQKIRAYPNTFVGKDRKWNREKGEYDDTYFSPLDNPVFGKGILLGETDENGVLQINLQEKIEDAFEKTFSSYDFDWDGNYDSFFLTSASDTNLTYLSSKWNGGISGWNFGYTSGSSWWWYGNSENMDEITLDRWGSVEPELYTHTYTDRKLYLPGEEVYIKSIIRNSKELSIPKGKELRLEVKDAKNKNILETTLQVSEFGSISDTLILGKQAHLGNYYITLYDGGTRVGNGGFSVEIFKNPKFKNEVMLQTSGMNEELVKIDETKVEKNKWGYENKTFLGKFSIKSSISSVYYSGAPVKNAELTYKVYKQYHYDTSYWSDCYYGCYWEPQKELYTEGKGKLDENGTTTLDIPVEFISTYSDYKYIVEVTVKDTAGDTISGTNSIVARLPKEYKRWDSNSGIYFKSEKRFYKAGEELVLEGGLTHGAFDTDYNDKFLLIIKKKNYTTKYVDDVRGYSRPLTTSEEIVEKILKVNTSNFTLNKDGKLTLNYTLQETGEYIFEFGQVNNKLVFDTKGLIEEFQKTGEKLLKRQFSGEVEATWQSVSDIQKNCDSELSDCSRKAFTKIFDCENNYVNTNDCKIKKAHIELAQKIYVDDLIDIDSRKYFTLVSYGNQEASNPVVSDNKITVLSEKISYKLGETARILVQLPFSNGKILLTTEKQGVESYEYIDVPGNIFFKEFVVDDSFMPNAYIGIVAIDTNLDEIPEYKVGYTEIVVDKTDKKTEITIQSNKERYEPREEVILDIAVKRQECLLRRGRCPEDRGSHELTVMVVDDSLISLMGNIDSNTLEKFYKKLPFQIQTSITNIAMLRNYYFSRQGIVGGSGFGNFKGGDSAVSSRNIFKNTAYYNPTVITNAQGKAQVKFTLPDNLTNFRVMVLSNSKDNFFGYSEDFIEVRKDVIVEDRTPLIIRDGDEIVLGANVFNTTDKEIGFTATLKAKGLSIEKTEQLSLIAAGESEFISWKVQNISTCDSTQEDCSIDYTISILGDSVKHSDKVEGKIQIEASPTLLQSYFISKHIPEGASEDLTLKLPENTDIGKSQYTLYISNNPLSGIKDIISSLAKYPYGCIEQTLSSTLPNAILKQYTTLFGDVSVSQKDIDTNISAGLERIKSMHLENGGFGYWQGDTEANLRITPYALRTLLELKKVGTDVPKDMITKTVKYLESNYAKAQQDEKLEILWALSKYYTGNFIGDTLKPLGIQNLTDSFEKTDLQGHDLLVHTYALVNAHPQKYKTQIDANIEVLKKHLDTDVAGQYYGYYNKRNDKAVFIQMLMDYNYADRAYISQGIMKLYDIDWSSYYYSTKTKNNAFGAFVQYMDSYGKDNATNYTVTLNGNTEIKYLGKNINSQSKTSKLSEVLKDGVVSLQVENTSGETLFVTATLRSHPKDILKVPAHSNGVTLKREIYEVLDTARLDTCEKQANNWRARYSDETQLSACDDVYKKHTGTQFKKGATYKVKLTAIFKDNKKREHLTFEDYLPASFRILNSKFKTNSIATSQNSTNDSWRWSHTEKRPEVVMAYANYFYGTTATYEYFITPDFAGTFTYPPATVYMMYQPDTRANSEFRRIEVK